MEYLAIVVVITLGLAGIGVWVASAARPRGDHPAAVVERVWSGLDGIASPPAWPAAPEPSLGESRFRRGARSVSRVVRGGGDVVATGAVAFGSGVGDGAWHTMSAFIHDPVGAVTGGRGVVAGLLRDPVGFTRDEIAAAVGYAAELRALPPREAYRRLMHDLGEAGADVALTRGKQLAVRSLLRAMRRRTQIPGDHPAGSSR